MSRTDFNDLHVVGGIDAVRSQLRSALKQKAPDSPPPPSELEDRHAEGRVTLEQALERFLLTMPDAKIWDSRDKILLRQSAAKILMGRKLFEEWLGHDDRRNIHQDMVKPEAAAAEARGGGGLADALGRYIYLYPTDKAWDMQTRQQVPMSALKFAIADCFDTWLKHPQRRVLDAENLVFDPTQKVDPESHINLFRGLPMRLHRRDDHCSAIRKLVLHLCNDRPEQFEWLVRWLAYPLQHVGAKMATAVLMHSQVQGSGKSLLFDVIMREIYGEYGSTVGQHQLESPYTDWRSMLLFGVFEEIFSREQKYQHTGTLKHMITGKTQRIEKKFVSGWEEANHMNAVFLSNEVQPFPVESSDRRMFVIWPRYKMPEDLKKAVLDEIHMGGIEAFYSWLLEYPVGDFGTHTEPPMTDEKERLIDFGRAGWEVFGREWLAGDLEVPLMPCLAQDLFYVYRTWSEKRREHTMSLTKFGGFMVAQEGISRRRDVHYSMGMSTKKGTFFVPRETSGGPLLREGESQAEWLGRCVGHFREMMEQT